MTENLTKYVFGGLAGNFLQSKENSKYTSGALDAFADKYLSEESKGFVEGAYASEEGIKRAVEIYSGKFEEEMSKLKGSELVGWYGSVLESLEDSEKTKIESELTKHGNSTLEEIRKKLSKAQYIIQAPEGERTDKERQEAQETMKKYQNFFVIQNQLDEYKFEEFRPEAIKFQKNRTLRDLTSRL